MDNPMALLDGVYLGNSLRAYLYSLLTITVGLLVLRVADRVVLRILRKAAAKTSTSLDDLVLNAADRMALPALYAVAIYLGLRDLELKPALAKALQAGVTVLVVVQAVRLCLYVAQEMLERQMARRAAQGDTARQSIRSILLVVKGVVWVLALILTLDNLGIRVTTFVAGLGITGIAVALAAQAVLGDLFSYFVIFFDRPFQLGHFIKIGDFMGVVETIGIKTTRLRSLSGEQIVMSNKYLTDNQVQNFGLMSRRRAVMHFEVEYGTTEEQLRAVPGVVRELLEGVSDATLDRAHFKEFADSGLRFEVVYHVERPEFNRYMDIQQELNLGLKRKLEAMGVSFAFPTRTLHVQTGLLPAASGIVETSKN